MKKVTFLLDEETDGTLKTIARCKYVSKSEIIRRILEKEAKRMAYRMGFLPKDEIEELKISKEVR